MELSDRLYKAFLVEMRELEDFRLTYATEHPSAPVSREDPDVRRLIEALGFFAARTRLAGQDSVAAVRQRILRQLLPYFLTSLPAMGLVEATPSGQFAESIDLGPGTELEIRSPGQPPALFRTLRNMRILPIQLERVEMAALDTGGSRFSLRFRAAYPRNEPIGTLRLFVDYLDDFGASLGTVSALRNCLTRAAVMWGDASEEAPTERCEVTFGTSDEELAAIWPHPLERERAFFHYPTMGLYLNVHVPAPPRNWQRFTIQLDVDSNWPRALRLNHNILRLFTSPVVNSTRSMSQPVVCDGTKERWSIQHLRPNMRFECQAIRGVYRITEGGLIPLRAGTLAGGNGSYEIVEERRDGRTLHALLLHLPEAFANEVTVAVEADWMQPWFSGQIGEKMTAKPYRRNTIGLQWDTTGNIVPHRDVELQDKLDELMHVLVLQHKSRLDHHDIESLLQALGSVWTGPFSSIRDLIRDVSVREVPLSRGGVTTGVKLVYEIAIRDHDRSASPLVEAFASSLGRILDAWIAEAPVEVRVLETT